ncbi:uncharacterized protein N7487_007620 [Penicillium crustosum]|uniref:uncharacterized protein n=1 Tax=Penicillium crustosum TaxID=36656 RepID=UPI00239EDE55|nr:uncharacterized protein N7487_007620 [Penicillium crustosum]KAJ5401724.1 hypothetical protein N7487_007620 [Penicillium crustosum]
MQNTSHEKPAAVTVAAPDSFEMLEADPAEKAQSGPGTLEKTCTVEGSLMKQGGRQIPVL